MQQEIIVILSCVDVRLNVKKPYIDTALLKLKVCESLENIMIQNVDFRSSLCYYRKKQSTQ